MKSVQLIDATSGKPVGEELKLDNQPRAYGFGLNTVFCWAFSLDGKYIALGGGHKAEKGGIGEPPANLGAVRVWNVATGELVADERLLWREKTGRVKALAFSKDGTKIFVAAEEYYLSSP